jgi:alpha/beta superfamily hydrolase
LHGGTLDNKVVFRAARGLQYAGLAVLRFNFRGVGRSDGHHDGHGGEALDLGAALDFMATRHPDLELWAGGFSFGSRTAIERATIDSRIVRLVLVAVPVSAFDVTALRDVKQPGFILMAENDQFGTLSELRRSFPDIERRFELSEIPGQGHFFDDTTQEVQARVRDYAERALEVKA